MDEDVELRLSHDEALVLFEFLTRFSHDERLALEDQAEERVLWDVQCLLEKQLVDPFLADYAQRLADARKCVRDC